MRCLFELLNGEIGGGMGGNVKNGVSGNPASKSCQLFGTAADKKDKGEQAISRPSRLIVRDARMCTDPDALKHTDLLYTEQKAEVGIDRLTSAANPRQFERVPAGTCFRLDLVLNVFTGDAEADEKELVDNTIAAMRLLQDDALGGQGSRGYGKIAIEVTQVLEKTNEHYTTNKPASESSLKNVFVSHFKAPAWAANGNELFKLKAEYTKERTATK
jgi:CRISPR-associated protein Csm3